MQFHETAEELKRLQTIVLQREKDLKKATDEYHEFARKAFDIQPSTNGVTLSDIAQVVAKAVGK
jgi:hypothetical protein